VQPAIIGLVLSSVFLSALAQIALRKTMLAAGGMPTSAMAFLKFGVWLVGSPWFLAGLACYIASLVIWLKVLSKTEVSLAYPLVSIGFVLTAILGYCFLNETVGPMRVSGIALICVGIIVLSQSA
jgi:multidrug transporter EmrE-like cation transporter